MKKRFKHTKTRVKRKTLMGKLDSLFSRHVRQKYAKNGWVYCFTCPKRLPWKQMQNGHYVSRSCIALRWDEDNCRPQCMQCNIFRGGQVMLFRENLVKEMGEDAVKLLEARRFVVFKPPVGWFEEKLTSFLAPKVVE